MKAIEHFRGARLSHRFVTVRPVPLATPRGMRSDSPPLSGLSFEI
jgi:hypothetical protein